MAAEGAKVVVTGRTFKKLESSCAEITKRGGDALAVECDIKDRNALESLVSTTVAHYGGIQILVNNAQEVPLGSLHEIEDEALSAGFESGPIATFRLMKLWKQFAHCREQQLVNGVKTVSARMSFFPTPYRRALNGG